MDKHLQKSLFLVMVIFTLAISGCDGFSGSDGLDGHDGYAGEKGDLGPQGTPGELGFPCVECVDSLAIDDGYVTGPKISALAVGDTELVDYSITGEKIGNSAVTTNKIADYSVTETKLGTVGTGKIIDGSLTSVEFGSAVVDTNHLIDNTITEQKLDTGAVRNRHVQNGTITNNKVVTNEFNRVWTISSSSAASLSNSGVWTLMDDMELSIPGNNSVYLVMFHSSFYSGESNNDLSVQIQVGTGAGSVKNLQMLPSNYRYSQSGGACDYGDLWYACSYPAHSHTSIQVLGNVFMHWTGRINGPGNTTVRVQWRNDGSNTVYQRSSEGNRTLTVIEFSNAGLNP